MNERLTDMNERLTVIASSSAGNGYVLTAGGRHLLLEAGVAPADTLEEIGFRIGDVDGMLVTHKHGDHSKYIPVWRDRYLFPVYSNEEVAQKYDTAVLTPKLKRRIGSFTVMPLEVPHGGVQNYAYIIEHPDFGRLLFATDLSDFPYTVCGINHICIEANYSEDIILDKMLENSDVHSGSENHMEICRCVETVKRLRGDRLRTVTLLHLSRGLSDETQFVCAVKDVSGYASVAAASNGNTIDLSLTDF